MNKENQEMKLFIRTFEQINTLECVNLAKTQDKNHRKNGLKFNNEEEGAVCLEGAEERGIYFAQYKRFYLLPRSEGQ